MQMDKKQTSLLALTMLAFGFLGYQIYQMVSDDVSQKPLAAPTQLHTISTPDEPIVAANTVATPMPIVHVITPDSIVPNQIESEEKDSNFVKDQTEELHPHVVARVALKHHDNNDTPPLFNAPMVKSQEEYLKVVNEYELAKMQRRLIEEQAAIAAARRRIVEIDNQTRQLSGNQMNAALANANQTGAPKPTEVYKLSYVDQQNGQWTATLNYQGSYLEVNTGNQLPDGSRVAGINHEGVILENKGQRQQITFNGAVALAQNTQNSTKTAAVSWQDQELRDEVKHLKQMLLAEKEREYQRRLAIQRKQEEIKQENDVISRKLGLRPIDIQVKIPEAYNVSLTPPPVAPDVKDIAKSLSQPKIFDNVNLTLDEKNILMSSPEHYAIQLVGSYHADVTDNFVIANQIKDKVKQYAIPYNGKSWHVVLYGDYATKEAAMQALQSLPLRLKPEGPWVMQYASAQKAIKNSLSGLSSERA